MADLRHVCCLRAYSGGTVPDSHRVLYSPLTLKGVQRHSNQYLFIVMLHQVKMFVKWVTPNPQLILCPLKTVPSYSLLRFHCPRR